VSIRKIQRILNSPNSLSIQVLLLQFPLALILAISGPTLFSSRHPLLRIELAIGLVLAAGICFAIGHLALKLLPKKSSSRQYVTLATWLLVGIQTKPSGNLLRSLLGGEQVDYGWRTALFPVVWIASLASVTHVLQSRSEYLTTYHELEQTEAKLAELERTSYEKLEAETRKLINSVQQTIQPELQQIANEIRVLSFQDNVKGIRNLLFQVDNYSIHTVRKLIDELYVENRSSQEPVPFMPVAKRIPLLSWRRLTLDPLTTFWIALSVSVSATLPTLGFQRPFTMVAQVFAILMPVFILNYVRKLRFLARHTAPVFWVFLACFSVVIFRLSLPSNSPLLVLRNPPPELALTMALLYAVTILLGSLNRYFADSYFESTAKRLNANAQLELSIQDIEAARLRVRRHVARIMHGPIQGRLSAIRLKLHVLSETSPDAEMALDEDDVAVVLALLEQISTEIENLGNQNSIPEKASLADALQALARKWRGIMHVFSDIPIDVQVLLANQNILTQKLVAACSEAITNASRHGYATQVCLTFSCNLDRKVIRLNAIDDGRGLQHQISPGFGLQDIEADGGRWRFEPSQSGAQLCIEFPFNSLHATEPVVSNT